MTMRGEKAVIRRTPPPMILQREILEIATSTIHGGVHSIFSVQSNAAVQDRWELAENSESNQRRKERQGKEMKWQTPLTLTQLSIYIFFLTEDKVEGRNVYKQAVIESSCCKGLPKLLKRRNSAFGNIHQSQTSGCH